MPRLIVSDHDPKFLSDLWKGLFQALGTKLLVSTVYHPQSDRQSERMNQTVEITLHYYLHKNLNKGWVEFLPVLRSRLNNAISASTDKAPNQIIFGFKTNNPLTLLRKSTGTEIEEERTIARREAKDSILFANVYMKTNYD